VWDVLVHVTVDHTHRRGRIRDVLLLADAIADCSPDDRDILARRTAAHPAGRAMEAQLTMAQAIGDKTPVVDTFEGVALTNYVVRGRTRRREPARHARSRTQPRLFAMLGGSIERRYFLAQQIAIPMEPSATRSSRGCSGGTPGLADSGSCSSA
jgi:anti-sigma factor RsiW